MTIGQNFNGFIQGMKYYKNTPTTNGPTSMETSPLDPSQDCLFFFIFTDADLDVQSQAFTNLAFF